MARNNDAGADVFGKGGGFRPAQVAGNPTLARAAINRKKRGGHLISAQPLCQPVVLDRVAAVIDRPAPESNNIAEKPATPQLVPFNFLMG